MKQLWKDEMINAKTRCWAQGMDGWRALHLIPQLKWSLLATGQAVLNETDLATLILNMLIRMCEYYPSRYLRSILLQPQGPHYTTIMKPPLKLPPNMAAGSFIEI